MRRRIPATDPNRESTMPDYGFPAFLLAAALLTITPGADTMLVIRNSLAGGARHGVVTTVGICAGLFVHALLSALGVSVILMHSAELFHILKFAGACWIIWLGVRSLAEAVRQGRLPTHGEPFDQVVSTLSDSTSFGSVPHGFVPHVFVRRALTEGFLSNVLNPKVSLFYLAFLPQFIGPADPVLAKSLLLTGVHYLMGMAWLIFLSGAVGRARALLCSPLAHRLLGGVCGVTLVTLGLAMAAEEI